MKKKLGILLICAGIFATSCSDSLLDNYEPGALTEDFVINEPSDLELLMNTAYASMRTFGEIDFNTEFSDETSIGFANGGQGLGDILTFVLNSSSGSPADIWASYYVALNYVNRVIKFQDRVSIDMTQSQTLIDADQATFDRALAEAYTLRAHLHLQLLTYFSTNPKDMNALGVLLSNDVYPITYTALRVTNGEVYAQIDSDLAMANTLYSNNANIVNTVFRANKNFMNVVKARSYALRGNYAEALTAADAAITGSGLTLTTFNSYNAMFHSDADAECIFKLKFLEDEAGIGSLWASVNTTLNGSPFFEMSRSLFNVLNTTSHATATNYNITKIQGVNLTIPGHTLQPNDMFVATETRPAGAYTANGNATIPSGSLLAGKVYWVRTVSGNNFTLSDQANGTSNLNFASANFDSALPESPTNNPAPIAALANAGDIRYSTMVDRSSIIDYNYQTSSNYIDTDKLIFRKYPGAPGKGFFVNDMKISRLSEMFLLKAEAQAGTGDLAGAAATVKQVRDRRFNRAQPLPVYADAAEAYRDILYERRKELAAEGFRFIDLKRLGAMAGVGIDRDPKDCELLSGACDLPVTDYRFALPIPEVESNPNPAILAQQNPGY